MTVARPQTGSLRPTLVIGVGSFGRRALLELRCRFLDRFGDLDKCRWSASCTSTPMPTPIKAAQRGVAGSRRFKDGEVYHLPLQPVVALPPPAARPAQRMAAARKALRHAALAQDAGLAGPGPAGLHRQLPAPDGPAASARSSRPCHPDAIYQTVSQTGLALRDNCAARLRRSAAPRGGASGFLPDLGYAVRRLAQAAAAARVARDRASCSAALRTTRPRRAASRPTSTPRSPS